MCSDLVFLIVLVDDGVWMELCTAMMIRETYCQRFKSRSALFYLEINYDLETASIDLICMHLHRN